jgi:ribosomal protein S18 acetylase RimI-like enzyme
MIDGVIFRDAAAADAPAVSEVYLASRKAFLPYAPLAHSDDEVRDYIAHRLIPGSNVTVAERHGEIVGMMSLTCENGLGWIGQFYLHPASVGRGIGTQLLRLAKDRLGPPIRLYTFLANQGARRFYERSGFQAIAFGDGSDNEEHCPDVLYEWDGDV